MVCDAAGPRRSGAAYWVEPGQRLAGAVVQSCWHSTRSAHLWNVRAGSFVANQWGTLPAIWISVMAEKREGVARTEWLKFVWLVLCLSVFVESLSCSKGKEVVSPDGPDTLCVCVDSDTLYDPSGEGIVECSDRYACWSPEGDLIAYTDNDHGSPQIWLMEPDGSEPRYLVDGSLPDWSPDGIKIAFERGLNIYVFSFVDSTVNRLTDDAGSAFPDWSPDGTKIAYDTTRGQAGMWVMNADGTGKRWVCWGYHPDWSPDGSALVYGGPPVGDNMNDVWIIGADGANPRLVTRGQFVGVEGPQWSPDGRRILWDGLRPSDGSMSIWVARPDGTGLCKMISGGATEASWSPDGKRVAHTRMLPGSRPGWLTDTIWVFEVENCSKTQVTFPPGGAR